MVMVREDGAYLPLQHCVQVAREKDHKVSGELNWFKDESHMVEWDLTVVSQQLEELTLHSAANRACESSAWAETPWSHVSGRLSGENLEGSSRHESVADGAMRDLAQHSVHPDATHFHR